MTIAYIDNPMGYICRLRRSDLMEVPDVAEKFESILTILASVLNIKVRFIILLDMFYIQSSDVFVNLVCSPRDDKDRPKKWTD